MTAKKSKTRTTPAPLTTRQVAQVVWLPVLCCVVLYGLVYGIRYIQYQRWTAQDKAQFEACSKEQFERQLIDKERIRLGTYVNTGSMICSHGTRDRGILGLP